MSNFPYRDRIARLPARENLVGFWPAREGAGLATADIAGGFDGTLVNGASWTQDAYGLWGINFTAASSQSISVGDQPALRAAEFTWALLVTPTGTITDNAYRSFVGAYNGAGSRANYTVGMNRSGLANGRTVYFEFSNTAGSFYAISGTTLLASGTPYMIVFSFNGTTGRGYVDGALENSGASGFAPDTSTSMGIAFGKLGAYPLYSSHTHHWGAMWNIALEDDQVAYLSTLENF